MKYKFINANLDFTLPDDVGKQSSVGMKYILKIIPHTKPYIKHFIIISLLSLVITLLSLTLPLTTKYMFDSGILTGNYLIVRGILLFVMASGLISMLLGSYLSFYINYLNSFISYKTRIMYYEKLILVDDNTLSSQRTGDLISRSGGLLAGLEFISNFITSSIDVSLKLIIIPFVLTLMDYRITIIAVPSIIVSSFIWRYCVMVMRAYGMKLARINAALDSSLLDIVSSIADIRNTGIKRKVFTKFKKDYVGSWTYHAVNAIVMSVFNNIQTIITILTTFIIGVIGWKFVIDGVWSIGKMAAVTISVGYLTSPFQQMFSLWDKAINTSIQVERYFEIYDLKIIKDDGIVNIPQKAPVLETKNLSYSYPDSDYSILKDINIILKPGQITAITGDSGSGKTTLLKLFARMIESNNGTITLDGIDYQDITRESFTNNLSYLSQNSYIFKGTIVDNITFGRTNVPDLSFYINKCCLSDVINKYGNNEISQGGSNISSGEKQRLILCRTLLYNKPFLLLDEPLSNVEMSMFKTILCNITPILKRKTCVIVTHNPYIFELSDVRYHLYGGNIIRMEQCHEK